MPWPPTGSRPTAPGRRRRRCIRWRSEPWPSAASTSATHTSKRYDDLLPARWDYLITVCDDANERCPFIPGAAARLHWSFEDPSRAAGDDADRLAVFRRVRDQIEGRITQWLDERKAMADT